MQMSKSRLPVPGLAVPLAHPGTDCQNPKTTFGGLLRVPEIVVSYAHVHMQEQRQHTVEQVLAMCGAASQGQKGELHRQKHVGM